MYGGDNKHSDFQMLLTHSMRAKVYLYDITFQIRPLVFVCTYIHLQISFITLSTLVGKLRHIHIMHRLTCALDALMDRYVCTWPHIGSIILPDTRSILVGPLPGIGNGKRNMSRQPIALHATKLHSTSTPCLKPPYHQLPLHAIGGEIRLLQYQYAFAIYCRIGAPT